MKIAGSLTPGDTGYPCTECGANIPKGEDAIVAMHAHVDSIEPTGEPQVVTYQYAGIYHSECFQDA